LKNGRDTRRLIEHVVNCVRACEERTAPFRHLQFTGVFPDDVYADMLRTMPVTADYRPLKGRNNGNMLADGTATRVKIDLFPEYIRHLPAEKRGVWSIVGEALCSREVQDAFVGRLAPGLRKRFGDDYAEVGMYPIPVLTRDVPGYRIHPHTDTHWKGITVQLYLPPDEKHINIGTLFLGRAADGTFTRDTQMRFAPNTGYAFAVGDDTWHSADPIGPEVDTRDSILLTYFVDAGALRFLRNRGKRLGNMVLNEARHLVPV
jgi:hypothetical protein